MFKLIFVFAALLVCLPAYGANKYAPQVRTHDENGVWPPKTCREQVNRSDTKFAVMSVCGEPAFKETSVSDGMSRDVWYYNDQDGRITKIKFKSNGKVGRITIED